MVVSWITPVNVAHAVDATWTDIDVTAHVSVNATGVILHVVSNVAGDVNFGYRKNGSTDNRYYDIENLGHFWTTCGIDGDDIFEVKVEDASEVDVWLVGYFEDEASFFTNAPDKTPGDTTGWQDVDISSDTGGDTAIAACLESVATFGAYAAGNARKNGSTDNRTGTANDICGLITGVDGSEVCEVYRGYSYQRFYLLGYIKEKVIMNTNATDMGTTVADAWTDFGNALPAGATGGFFDVKISPQDGYFGVRKNGTAEDIHDRINNLMVHASCECDASQIIEYYVESSSCDFYLMGYSSPSVTYTKSFTADAILVDRLSKTFTADAILKASGLTKTFTGDGRLVRYTAGDWSATADFTITSPTVEKTFIADAILVNRETKAFTADAFLQATLSKAFSADAYLRAVETKAFTADAFLRKTASKEFIADAIVVDRLIKEFSADAYLQKEQSKTFEADGILVNRHTKELTADAFLRAQFTKEFTADAIIVERLTKEFTADAYLRKTYTKTFTADVFLRKQQTKTFTADAYLRKSYTKQFTADAFLQATETKQFTADSILVNRLTKTFTSDAYLRAVQTKTFTADAQLVCGREFGGNWQRKMWFNDPYYWRSRQNGDNLIFEYIHKDNLAGDNWATNANATISCPGCGACFTVRGGDGIIPTTIHYSDGTDTYVAESDEASATGWAWQNTTKVFDATESGDWYKKVNLASDRNQNPLLWATAVFYDSSTGKQWVQSKTQTSTGDITAWDAKRDVSNVDNTAIIWGCSDRSVGEEAEKNDMIICWKEGATLKSRYWDNNAFETEQTIATGYATKARFDFEHSEDSGNKHVHVVYVAADGSVEFRERALGATGAWQAAETVDARTTGNGGVGIVEHEDGLFSVIWEHDNTMMEFRIRDCDLDTWDPILANDSYEFNPATDAVAKTTTVAQILTADSLPAWTDVAICWIGADGAEACAEGFGVLIKRKTKEFSADAILKATFTKEFTADAYLQSKGLTKAFTADAILQVATVKQFTADAILKATFTKEITADAFLRKVQAKEFIADAILVNRETKTFSADAFLLVTQTKTFTGNAVVVNRLTKTFTADALLRVTYSKSFTADAFLRAVFTKTFSADAYLRKTGTKQFSADAFLRARQTKTIEADAILVDRLTKTFTADAFLQKQGLTKTFTADAFLRRTGTKAFEADAIVVQRLSKTFSADVFLRKTSTKTFTASAIVVSRIEKTFTADAFLRATGLKTFIADAILQATATKTFTANAVLIKIITKTFSADAMLRLVATKEFTADAILRARKTKAFTADAWIRLRTTKTFIANAILRLVTTKTFTADAMLIGTVTKAMTADAILYVPFIKSGLDVYLRKQSLDVELRKPSLDVKLRKPSLTLEIA